MQTIRKKLHSNSGASMIMALLLMLVGVVTSAVIIAASLSAALHIKEDRAQQQAYLTVSSAAELIRDQLEAGKSNYKKTVTEVTKTPWYSWQSSSTTTNTVETITDDSAIFSSIVESAIKYLKDYPTSPYKKNYTISVDSENAEYDVVSVEVFIKKAIDDQGDKYSLTIWFTGGKKPNQCRMVLTMDGIIVKNTQDPTTETGSWLDGYKSKTTTITTTTIKWQNPHLQRKETTN